MMIRCEQNNHEKISMEIEHMHVTKTGVGQKKLATIYERLKKADVLSVSFPAIIRRIRHSINQSQWILIFLASHLPDWLQLI